MSVVISWTNAGKRQYGENHWFWAVWDVGGIPGRQWNKSEPAESGFCRSATEARRAAWSHRSRGYRLNWALHYVHDQREKDVRPCFSRCRSGRQWFWVVTADLFDDPKAEGLAQTPEAALEAAIEAVGDVRPMGNWRADGILRRKKAEERRKTTTDSLGAHRLEFVYECFGRDRFSRHRIVKRTKKRIFIERDHYSEDRRPTGEWWDWDVRTVVLDRAEFERERKVWCRRLHCDLYASPDVYLQEREMLAVPECFSALGLGIDATTAEVKQAYRRLAKQHHPDSGGDPAEFKRVRRLYEQAMARVA